jgi:hypothetical protein
VHFCPFGDKISTLQFSCSLRDIASIESLVGRYKMYNALNAFIYLMDDHLISSLEILHIHITF